MTSTVRARLVLAAAMSVALGFVLSGCSALGTFLPHTFSASAKPAVGDCWTSSVDTAVQAATWTAGGAVGCGSRHQLYTYAIITVKSSAATWRTSGGNLDDGIATDAYQACEKKFSGAFVGTPESGRLTRYFFVAPEDQWKKGARWVRCDLGVFKTGSLLDAPAFASLPPEISTLEKQLESTPDLFATCVTTTDSSGQTGPLDDSKAVIADCTQNYQWRMESTFTIPGGQSDPYPDDNALNAVTQTDCGDAADEAASGWIAYLPTRDNWVTGDRSGSCWFLAEPAPET